MSKPKKAANKVFEEDNIDDDFEDENDEQLLNDERNQKSDTDSKSSQNYEFETLGDLIMKLNDKDHSEDEGIQDYKIGGYHPCHIGQVLINRYVLVQKLGWGHFSTVWLAKDFKYKNYVAVKIMKSSPHYLQASYDQVQILQKVASYSNHPQWLKSLKNYQKGKQKYGRDDTHVLNLLNSFLYKGPYGNHFCMVFEILGVNLLQVLKRYDYKGLPLDLVKQISRQVLMGLDFLNRICRVIHTDLKPQNVLLCLTQQQIRKIVEDGQLANKSLYNDRLKLYRTKYKMGPAETQQSQNQQQEKQSQIGEQYEEKIQQIERKLTADTNLSKNQKRNLKKKIRKLKTKGKVEQEHEHQKFVLKPKLKNQKQEKPARQLFKAFHTKLILDKGPKLQKGFKVKIADLGNACWEHHHFATQIQTRQYRGPEVLTGSKYNLSADMWSFACMTFQMLTGELLFNPRKDKNDNFGKNDDHLAQMMQLLGRFPKKFSLRGAKSKKYYAKQGQLKRIPRLQNWSLKDVMIAKYRFTEQQAKFFEEFMSPMLNCYPEKRKLAHQMLEHPWLHSATPKNYFMSKQQYEKIKAQKYDLQVVKQQVHQYQSQNQFAETEDNHTFGCENEDQFYGYQKVGNIKLIDRSFMDLGYIGYGDGIFLERLDAGPNWQFDK